jgi:hypothetical protein
MNKTVLVGLAILTVSTSAASAAAISPRPYARPMNAYGAMGAPPPPMPGVTMKNYDAYMKNLHDSGYDPKNDFTKSGTMRQN